jgi:Subtilase family
MIARPEQTIDHGRRLRRCPSLLAAMFAVLTLLGDDISVPAAFAAGHRDQPAGARSSVQRPISRKVWYSHSKQPLRAVGLARHRRETMRRKQHSPVRARRPPPSFRDFARPTNQLAGLPHRSQQAPSQRSRPEVISRQILVLVNGDEPTSIGSSLAQTYGLHHLSSQTIALLDARAELFHVPEGRSESAVLEALQQDRRVRLAQLNRRYFHTDMQSHRYQHTGEEKGRLAREEAIALPQYGPLKLALPEAHQIALGRNVRIAVIDASLDTAHPDLKGAVIKCFDAVGGRDASTDFHGTAVAGIIRARGVVEGAAPEANLLAVRAFRAVGPASVPETTTDVLISAVDWAFKNGARIINMSFVGTHDPVLQQLLAAANRKGIVVVAAAGNGGPDAPAAYPAAYPGVIAVTAIDQSDARYVHANRGSYITVAAPGVDILAPVEQGGHAYVSGTSFAAAYVSGIAALLLERDPELDAHAVTELITMGADDVGPSGRDDEFGAGRANALSSLQLLLGSGPSAKK